MLGKNLLLSSKDNSTLTLTVARSFMGAISHPGRGHKYQIINDDLIEHSNSASFLALGYQFHFKMERERKLNLVLKYSDCH
jgi:hypothetical protein